MNTDPTDCRFCGQPLEHTFCDLGMSPLSNAYVSAADLGEMERFYPLHARVCANCLLVQVPSFEAPERIFSDYAYFSSYSESWLAHCKAYADAVSARFGLGERSLVIEIASNDGYLLQFFKDKGIPALGIEPAANVAEVASRRGIDTLVRFFSRDLAEELGRRHQSADLVVANNVLAHVPDLHDFVAGLARLLNPQGVLTVEFPHIKCLIEQNQFDTIYHEHLFYFSLLVVRQVFAHHGLAVFDVEKISTHGGSLRVFAQLAVGGRQPVSSRVEDLLLDEERGGLKRLSTYVGFADKAQTVKMDLLEFLIAAKRQGHRVVGYGAPAKGNTLLNYCGVRSDLLPFTVDRNPAKQGRYLPGTHIPIYEPEQLRRVRPDYVLILPWNLRDEISAQLAFVREWGGRLLVSVPRVEVVA
jgi:SAM-dependent methyltransferase